MSISTIDTTKIKENYQLAISKSRCISREKVIMPYFITTISDLSKPDLLDFSEL